MVIQHNLFSMNASRMYNINVNDRARISEKMSSGYRIHRAADDAAGLAISEKMRRQIKGLTQAVANAQDGVSLIQSAEGALQEVHEMLQRLNELCVQGANETLTEQDREYIQAEVESLQSEINRTGASTTFNEIHILGGANPGQGSSSNPQPLELTLQVGSESDEDNTMTLKIGVVNCDVLGISGVNVRGADGQSARNGIDAVKGAIEINSRERANLGSYQNRLEHTIKNLENVVENTTAAESNLRDAEMAQTISDYKNKDIIVQAGQMILAQANQSKQSVLQLLQ